MCRVKGQLDGLVIAFLSWQMYWRVTEFHRFNEAKYIPGVQIFVSVLRKPSDHQDHC